MKNEEGLPSSFLGQSFCSSEMRVPAVHLHQQHFGAIAWVLDTGRLELVALFLQREAHECDEPEAESDEDEGLDECSHRGSFLWCDVG